MRSASDSDGLGAAGPVEVASRRQQPEQPLSAANVLLIRDTILLPASFPQTKARLEERGISVRAIDVSELQKAEAGVTCCSIMFESLS